MNVSSINNKNTIIVDLDGTIAIVDKRKLISTNENDKIEWKHFFNPSNIELDQPNTTVIKALQLFKASGYKIVILSGRSDITKERTIAWLNEYDVPFDHLLMRPYKDFRPDDILKKELFLNNINIDDVFFILDDRQKVVDMWRSMGLTCWQVAVGDF